MMNDVILDIRAVSKRFGNYQALENVNLTVKRGDVYGLIGENGAGKTTLMKLITGLSPLTQGQITLLGESAQHYHYALRRTGAIIETPVAFPNLTVRQNLKVCAIQHGLQDAQIIDETLEFVHLVKKQRTRAKHLSLGQRQRLGLALAILPRPDFLVLDEPINGLDPTGIIDFQQLIKRLSEERDTTILISSHILSELYQVSNRFGIIHHGQLIKQVTKEELDEANQAGLIFTVDKVQLASQTLDQSGYAPFDVLDDQRILIKDNNVTAANVNQVLVENGVAVKALTHQEGSLEQYYTDLLAKEDQRHAKSN